MPQSPTAQDIKRTIEARDRRVRLAQEEIKVNREVSDVEQFISFDQRMQRAFKGIVSRPRRRAMMIRSFGTGRVDE